MFRIRNADDTQNIDFQYGPVVLPNFFPYFFFEKASTKLKGGIEIEPKAQLTKVVDFYMNLTPENADFFYTNMGGYVKDYEPTLESQKYQVQLEFNNGIIGPAAGANYHQITEAQFTGGTGANVGYRYTTKGASQLAT